MIFNHADLIQRYSLQCYSHIFKCTLLYTFSSCILCQEIHLQISLSDPIPLDPPHCHSLSPSPLFFLSPSLESHMVSLKWSTIKRGAQGARCPHLFSCTAWAACSLVETASCDILWGKFARCIYAARTKKLFHEYQGTFCFALQIIGGHCIFLGVWQVSWASAGL